MTSQSRFHRLVAGLLLLLGASWLWMMLDRSTMALADAQVVNELKTGNVARMDSPPFVYSPDWQVSEVGADPAEPADAFATPSGVISFTYRGDELALQLAVGSYWGYLYATVDGQPVNLLPAIAGNVDSRGQLAGYKPFYEPEKQTDTGPSLRWVKIHRSGQADAEHQVRIEVWRSWGQTPIRAVAIDALPGEPWPSWPGVLMMLLGVWVGVWGMGRGRRGEGEKGRAESGERRAEIRDRNLQFTTRNSQLATLLALLSITAGVLFNLWWLCLGGIGLLALVGLMRPVCWLAVFVFALPFYFSTNLPLLPGRSIGIIDLGVFGGAAIILINRLFINRQAPNLSISQSQFTELKRLRDWRLAVLWLIIGWALVATFAAEQFDVALREWRTVFLSAGLFALMLRTQITDHGSRITILSTWIAGATAVALIGLTAYAVGYEPMLVGAEGVTRLRSLYGSPNNLAAYLERTLALSLALALFAEHRRTQLLFGVLVLPQAAAFLLTFSKGGLFLGLPAMMFVLAIGGALILRQRQVSLRPLLWLTAVAVLAAVALIPVFGTERFRGLLDFSSNTSLFRLSLWRSAWQMAFDHPWLGVGPDNFLYAFRGGYLLPVAWQEPDLNHPHNFILDWWTRLGVIGLGLGLAWWAGSAWQLWGGVVGRGEEGEKGRRGEGEVEIGDWRLGDWEIGKPEIATRNSQFVIRNPQSGILSLGLLAAMAAGLAHGLIDVSYALPDLMLAWVLIGELGKQK